MTRFPDPRPFVGSSSDHEAHLLYTKFAKQLENWSEVVENATSVQIVNALDLSIGADPLLLAMLHAFYHWCSE